MFGVTYLLVSSLSTVILSGYLKIQEFKSECRNMSSTLGKSGQVISGQTREVIYNVYSYLKNLHPTYTLKQLKETVSEATKVSVRSVANIIKEGEGPTEDGKPRFSTPGKKRPRPSPVTDLEDFEKSDFRNIVYNLHKTEGARVTISALREKLHNDLGWHGGATSLRVILKDLGFKWHRTENNRKLLIEKNDIRALRINYLEKIKFYRELNRPIIYMDETYVHSGHTQSKSWSDGTTNGLLSTISKGPRMIVVHAGGEMGFLPGCSLIFKSGTSSGDYHDEMNSSNYEKWLREKLLPNLPPQSVLVIDNAPYHNVQVDRAPTSNSKKADMVKWLIEKKIPFTPSMYRSQLYEIIKLHKKEHITYKFDSILSNEGHTVLRLPPYHPDLNPIELIWAQVKNNVATRNTTFNFNHVRGLLEEELAAVTQENWQKCCNKVIDQEKKYLEKEILIDVQVEKLVINLEDDSETESGWLVMNDCVTYLLVFNIIIVGNYCRLSNFSPKCMEI